MTDVDVSPTGGDTPARGPKYRSLFPASGENGGFESRADFLRALHSGRADSRLDRLYERAMSGTTGSDGGFLVPDEFAAPLMDGSLESKIVRPRAQIWAMNSNERKIPATDGADHTSVLSGGVVSYWVDENTTVTPSSPENPVDDFARPQTGRVDGCAERASRRCSAV